MSEALALSFDESPVSLDALERAVLADREAVIEHGLNSFIEVGSALLAIRDTKLYRDYGTFEHYLEKRWPQFKSWQHAYRLMDAAEVTTNLKTSPMGEVLPGNERQARPLTTLKEPEQQQEAWQRAQEIAGDPSKVTAKIVEQAVEEIQAEQNAFDWEGIDDTAPEEASKPTTSRATVAERTQFIPLPLLEFAGVTPLMTRIENPPTPKFNRTNENVEWALWTWNPITGCLHDCNYCYARDIAIRFYPEEQGFTPTFHPDRLGAPRFMGQPAPEKVNAPFRTWKGGDGKEHCEGGIGEQNVFVCSMADLFGKWVPRDWIDRVLEEVVAAPEWNFLFLTKFPQRLCEFEWPVNAWVGTTVDRQYRVDIAEKAFRKVTASVKWLSCEPMLEPLQFTSLEMFDWVVVGGSSRSSQTPEFHPPHEWVIDLYNAARRAGCQWYEKPNLLPQRIREYPGAAT